MTIRQRLKRCPALIMAMAMVWSLPVYVSAEDAAQNDEPNISELTANVETDVCQVVMPTNTEGIFDFILDPQGLINETDGAMYKGKKFEKDCTVFFRRLDGKVKEDYSRKSDSVTITNKSTMPVEVSLEVKVDPASLAGIEMTEDRKFKKDKSASLYLAVTDGEKEVPVGKDGVTVHKTIVTLDEYSFQITGSANKKGDWAGLGKAAPKIVVTWKVTPKENAELRKDAVLKEDTAADESDEIPEQQEEGKNPAEDEKPEDKEAEIEQAAPVGDEGENEQEQEQEAPDNGGAIDGEDSSTNGNENINEDLNDIAE